MEKVTASLRLHTSYKTAFGLRGQAFRPLQQLLCQMRGQLFQKLWHAFTIS